MRLGRLARECQGGLPRNQLGLEVWDDLLTEELDGG
jgi:hypothetical protein